MSDINGTDREPDKLAGLLAELQQAEEQLGLCEYIDSYPAVERCREKCQRRIAHLKRLIEELAEE